MDQHNLFRRLTVGVTFDKNKFLNDALKLQIVKAAEPTDQAPSLLKLNPAMKRKLVSTDDPALNTEPEQPGKRRKNKGKNTKNERRVHRENVNRIRNANKIHIWGSDLPDPIEAFSDIPGLPSTLLENISGMGFHLPTAVQMQAIPIMLQGREAIVNAPTGSGKTMSFLIPLVLSLGSSTGRTRNVGFRAVIVSPTRELAKQIYRECQRFTEKTGLKTLMIDKKDVALEKFKKTSKCDILITTPNRLVYLLKQEAISLKSVEMLIVDECDNLFEEGFQDQLGFIYSACDGPAIKRWFFSATCAHEVEQFAKTHLDNHIVLSIGPKNAAVDLVEQEVLYVGSEAGKLFALRDLIRNGVEPPVLVFVASQERANELFSELIYEGVNCAVIHSGKTQSQRESTMEAFRTGKVWILITTQLLARGVDFQGLKLVINYDMPATPIQYIHSIGRTGRAGKVGRAVTFFTEDDRENLRRTAQVLQNSGFPVPPYLLKMKKSRRKEAKVPERAKISRYSTYVKPENRNRKGATKSKNKPNEKAVSVPKVKVKVKKGKI